MRKIISIILVIAITTSLAIPAIAEETEAPQYGSIKVEYSDSRGSIENLEVMILDGYVYANVDSFSSRLGYKWEQNENVVSIYSTASLWGEQPPALTLHFRIGDTSVSYNPMCGIEVEYTTPAPCVQNERGIWVPFSYTLYLLGGSRNIAGDVVTVQMPAQNVLSIAAMITNNEPALSFDWVDDFGYSEQTTNVTDGAARVVTLFKGLLAFDGSAWSSFIDWNAFDKKFGRSLAAMLCTYSSDELMESIEEVEVLVDVFDDNGALGSMFQTQQALIDSDVNAWSKVCELQLNNLKAGSGTLPQYNMVYQQYERATKQQDLLSAVGADDLMYIQDELSSVTNVLDKATKIGYAVSYLSEFQQRDSFQATVLQNYFATRKDTDLLDDATASAIAGYASSGMIEYTAQKFCEEHLLEIIVDETGLDALMGAPANLLLLAWDIMSETIPFYSEGLENVEAREISNYAQQVQNDAAQNLNTLIASLRADSASLSPEDCVQLAEYCYVYLKSCYIARSSAIDSLKNVSEETREILESKISVETEVNLKIAKYLSILSRAGSANPCYILGFLPKNNNELVAMYTDESIVDIVILGSQNQTLQLPNSFTYVDVGTSTAALTQNGDLYMWGMNDDGEIGNGTTKDQLTPQKIMTNISYVVCNGETTAAIDWEGDLYMWGGNSYGTIGNGTMKDVYLPTKILSDVKTVQLSATNVYALTNSGDLYAWGLNKFGYVGNGEEDGYQLTPYKVIENIRSIVYVPTCMFAISNDHNLYAWGKNDNGQLGTGTTINQSTPVKILSNVSLVCGNRYFAGAITISGELFMWGKNDYGQLGDGTTTDRLSPVKILTDVVTAEVSENKNTFAITSDNSLYVWGYNYYGQVGNGTEKTQNKPIKILTDVICATMASSNVAAITSTNELYIWGDNIFGQVGDGKGGYSSLHQTKPIKIMDNIGQVTFPSSRNVLAISLSGDLYSWGEGENGEIGNGKTDNQITPVLVLENIAESYSQGACMNAITNDGKLLVWGYNMYGQLGTGSKKDQLTPYEIDISDISDDPIIQAEIQEMDGGIYAAFIEDGGYHPFIDGSGLVGEPTEYTVIDIDQDGTPELLLNADDGWGFCMTYVFSVDNTTQSINFIDSIYSYAGISYSEQNQCITYCYPKPTAMEGSREFFKLSDGEFALLFGIYYTDYDNYSLVEYNSDGSVAKKTTLTESQWDDYVRSDSRLDWQEIS